MKKYLLLSFAVVLCLYSCKQTSTETQVIQEAIKVTLQEFMSEDSSVLHRFDEEIAAYRAMDRDSMPPEGAWLFVGSSSFRLWPDMAKDLAPNPVINRGFGGSNMVQLVHYMDSLVYSYKPSHIFIYEGDNDIVSEETSPEDVRKAVMYFVQEIQEKMPDVPLHFVAVKPSPSRKELLGKAKETNALIKEEAENTEGFYYIDIASPMMVTEDSIRQDIFISDNLHMNQDGYDIWSDVILRHMGAIK